MAKGKGKGKGRKLPEGQVSESAASAPEASASEPVAEAAPVEAPVEQPAAEPEAAPEAPAEEAVAEAPAETQIPEEDNRQYYRRAKVEADGSVSHENIEVTSPEHLAQLQAEDAPKPEAPKTPLFSTPHPDDEVLDIESASSQMLDGYKESWLAAVRAKARSMGVGEKATRREWRAVFIAWGGVQILK